jgi:hypothetical protein
MNVIDFNNSRHLDNCTLLCYNNSSIHLLYSIKEFRDVVYNTLQITNSNKSKHAVIEQYDINELLYRLKFVFYLLNKNLVKQQSDTKYDIDDNTLFCSRGGPNNDFYNEIYYDLIKYTTILDFNNQGVCHNELNGHLFNVRTNVDITSDALVDDICRLENTSVSTVSLQYYLNVFKDISESLFTYFKNPSNSYEFFISTDYIIINRPELICKKYLLYTPITKNIEPSKRITLNSTEYQLCGLIVGWNQAGEPGEHFFTLLYNHSTNRYTEINDLNTNINTNYKFNPSNTPIQFILYVKQDENVYIDNYPVTTQIDTLAKISNKGLSSDKDILNYNILKNIIINKIN